MNRVMVDLETMATSPNAAIISIGAVRFGSGQILDEFYQVVDLNSSLTVGLEIEADTLLWWMQQDDIARKQFLSGAKNISTVLDDFAAWLGQDAEVWGNGAAFDNVILTNAYKKCGKKRPWAYYNDRCYRTIKALYPNITLERAGTHHIAVDDSRHQAKHLMMILPNLSGEFPHKACKTPSECRKEGLCFDPWNCSC